MKRALTSAGVVLVMWVTTGISGCTQNQIDFFLRRQAEVQATETVQDDQEFVEFYNDLEPEPETTCKEWYWTAIEAGWTRDQWGFLAQTMWAESRCIPNVTSSAGARGLMQEMPFWAPICGITVDMLFDPLQNLKCALVTFNKQGKTAWSGWDGRS